MSGEGVACLSWDNMTWCYVRRGRLHACCCHSQCESRYVNNESSHVSVSGCIRNQELYQKWHVCQIHKNKQRPKYFFRLEYDVHSLIAATFFVAVFGLPCSADFLCLIGSPVKKNLSMLAVENCLGIDYIFSSWGCFVIDQKFAEFVFLTTVKWAKTSNNNWASFTHTAQQ